MLSLSITVHDDGVDFLDILTLTQMDTVVSSLSYFYPCEGERTGFVRSKFELFLEFLDLFFIQFVTPSNPVINIHSENASNFASLAAGGWFP